MSNSEKKMLANQIKTDLKKDLEQAKKSDRETPPTYFKSLGECGDCQGERLNFAGVGSADYLEQNIKRRKGDIFPNELESTDWVEIDNLLNQIDKLNNEKRERDKKKHEDWKAKRDEKLKSSQKIFYYEYLDELWDAPDEVYHFFLGYGEDGKGFHLMVPENHPAINNLPCCEEFPKRKKEGILCLIEGAENITYTQHPKINNRNGFLKWVKLEDKIAITLLHDEGGLNQESCKSGNSDFDLEQSNNKNLQDLVKNPNERAIINSTSISPEKPQDNSAFGMSLALGIGGILLLEIVIILLIRKKTNQKLKYR